MTHQPANRPACCDLCLRHGARPPLARRRRRARLPSAAWLDGPRRPDRSASPHGPRLAARRVVDHRNQGITSRTGPKPCRLGAGGRTPGAAVAAPGFAQSQNAPSPPSDRRRWGHKGARARNPRSQQVWRRIAPPTIDRAPPQWAGWWLRPGLLRQVARKRAVPDAGGSLSVRHERRFTDTPPSLASMELPHHASVCGRELRQGRSGLVVGALTWPASGRKPVQPSRGDAELATSPFGSGRPVRPCLVVNPGGGAAALVLDGRNLAAKTISPALRAFLAGQILFASRFSTLLRPLCGATSPSPPAGSQQGRTGATLFNPKGETSWLTSAPSPQRKTASPARFAP